MKAAPSSAGRFGGFADANGKFFASLAKNNDRAWFEKHKAEYEEGWNAPMKALLAEVRSAVDATYAHCDLAEPKVFRIHRDVRFSKDKSPYKTHVGGFLPLDRKGKSTTDLPMALYFHVGAGEAWGAAGHYMMGPESLVRFRAAVADDRGKELAKIVGKLEKAGYPHSAHDALKKVPKGFDPDHPRADFLKMKGLTVRFPAIPKALLTSGKLPKHVADACKKAAPLVEWLVYATA